MGIVGNVINISCPDKKGYSSDWPNIHIQCIDPKSFIDKERAGARIGGSV